MDEFRALVEERRVVLVGLDHEKGAAAQATEGLRLGTGILRWVLLLAVTDLMLAIAGVLTARPLEESES